MAVERAVPGVESLVGDRLDDGVPAVKLRAADGSSPLSAAARRLCASFLMLRNWNWMPSGVESPKYLQISRAGLG